jgi:SAM-dependent methyltransferase
MTATAVEAWDERWATPEGRADWLVPHPTVTALVPVLKARGTQTVLDLGCGIGRHALFFAEHPKSRSPEVFYSTGRAEGRLCCLGPAFA